MQLRRRIHLNHQNLALRERKVILVHQVARLFGIVHHQPDNRAIGCVQDGHRQNMHRMRAQHADKIMEPAEFIGRKH